MTYTVPKAVADANRGVFIFDDPGQFDHRGMVLRVVCDLEGDFADLLFEFFKLRNPLSTWERAQKELFSENGLLGSLSRMARLGYYLGLVDDDEAHDLRIFVKLRNMYAHGRNRDQFYRDSTAASLVTSLRLYQNSPDIFVGFHEQGIFLSCHQVLHDRLRAKKTNLDAAWPVSLKP